MDVNSFWRAVQQVLSTAIPRRVVGLTFRRNPASPIITRWTRRMPEDFFAVEPLKSYLVGTARKKCMRLSIFFWKRQRLICRIAIMRSAEQGDFSPAEVKFLRGLYPQFMTALRRIEPLERERSVRIDFEAFLSRLPLPTIILQWNLKPIYQNQAAREFCAVWEKGPEEAKLTKAASPIPCAILDRCRLLKQQWMEAKRRALSGLRTIFEEEQVHHPSLPYLRATVRLRDVQSAGVARPHFLIECEDLSRN